MQHKYRVRPCWWDQHRTNTLKFSFRNVSFSFDFRSIIFLFILFLFLKLYRLNEAHTFLLVSTKIAQPPSRRKLKNKAQFDCFALQIQLLLHLALTDTTFQRKMFNRHCTDYYGSLYLPGLKDEQSICVPARDRSVNFIGFELQSIK